MKKKILLIFICFIIFIRASFASNVCGCSGGYSDVNGNK